MSPTTLTRAKFFSAAALFLVVLSGCSRGSAGSGPTQADIEKLLKASYTDALYATRVYQLSVDSVQRGDPRVGDQWADGTPANKTTTVYPCKVIWTRITSYSTDKSVVKERFTGEYVFFRDEFGAWTFRGKQQSSERISATRLGVRQSTRS